MEASKLKEILEQHKLWLETNEVQGERANLKDANLEGANLIDADLSRADLRGASLWGASLTHASLTHASLTGANLKDANLKDADLRRASLYAANLTGANLWSANLWSANLKDAILWGANLTGASLRGANLRGANLRGPISLPNISWIIPGCLVQLNGIKLNGFWLMKERKWENFVQDSFGFFIQNNLREKTFDMLVEDRVIRGIPDWVKYSGLKQIESV